MKNISRLLIYSAMSLMVVACSSARSNTQAAAPAGKTPAPNQIVIDNFSFTPAVLTVKAGSKVTWTNHDDIPHNIVSSDQKFQKSKPLDTDDSFTYTFTEPGTYQYFCGLHPKMVGKVVVEAAK